jgi:hypothetical protein
MLAAIAIALLYVIVWMDSFPSLQASGIHKIGRVGVPEELHLIAPIRMAFRAIQVLNCQTHLLPGMTIALVWWNVRGCVFRTALVLHMQI